MSLGIMPFSSDNNNNKTIEKYQVWKEACSCRKDDEKIGGTVYKTCEEAPEGNQQRPTYIRAR